MAEQDLAGRTIDVAFCRAYYNDLQALSDADLRVRAGAAAADVSRPLNPVEFLQQVVARRLVPADFDWRVYVFLHADCRTLRLPWQATLHYLRRGQPEARAYGWSFDAEVYRRLYPDDAGALDAAALAQQWRDSGGTRFASVLQAAYAGGFASLDWLQHFDAAGYVRHNGLFGRIANEVQARVHFLTVGWRDVLPLSADLEFDARFVRDLAGPAPELSDAELYRRWLEIGLAAGVPPNEAALLRKLDLELAVVPDGFDWRRYVRDRPAMPAEYTSKWGALEHLVRFGVAEPGILPLTVDAAQKLLIAIARRFARQGDPSAMRVVDRCSLYSSPPPQMLQSLGEIAHIDKQFARALQWFRQVHRQGGQTLLTFLRAGESALELGDAAEAQIWGLEGLAAYPRSVHLEGLLMRVQAQLFDAAVARHVGALRRGEAAGSEISTDLRTLYEGIVAFWRSLGGAASEPRAPAAPAVGARPLRVVMLANTDLPQCTFYRVAQKRAQIAPDTAHLVIIEQDAWQDFVAAAATADVALFYRVAASVPVLRCLAWCEANAIPTVYEIDDLMFDPLQFPEPLAAYGEALTADQHFQLQCGVALVRFALRACDYAVASTDALRAQMAPLVRSRLAVTHRNCLPADFLPLVAAGRDRAPPQPHDPLVIFYGSGTRAHAADFHIQVEPALLRLMAEFPQVCFLACGHVDAARLAAAFPERVDYVALQTDRTAYAALLLSADINIAVLGATLFNACKSEIKWLEAAMLSVPTVASDVAGLREVAIPPDDLVVCAPEAEAWYQALRGLVADPVRRRAVAARACATALARYQPLAHGRDLERHLRAFAAGAAPAGDPVAVGKPRVLVVNVFFPPQSIGGATRVVGDHVAALQAHYSDRFTVAVACGNAEAAPPHLLTSYLWNGVRVYSISTKLTGGMDWAAEDAEVTRLFGEVLAAFGPDLVHFHCIQRLGAGLVEATAARGVPYVVTVHDAWWISDHQFLLDDEGRPQMPWQPERHATAANPNTRAASRSRRARLHGCLAQAAAVTVVSAPFADIYRRAGVAGVEVIANGLPVLPPLEPRPRPHGKLRLGHVGGTGAPKGLHLLRTALKRQRFPAFELLAVDDTIGFGEQRREVWGATEVTFVGRTPQDRVGALYGRFDVLVAPSVWPESFGLVVREALAYGKWVVAADRGALAEPVIAGENGLAFDPDDPAALADVLQRLHADPDRFAVAPRQTQPPRMAGEQTAEFVSLYRRVLDAATSPPAWPRRAAAP